MTNLQLRGFKIERIFGVNLVEASSCVEKDLPNMVDISLPFVTETSLDIHLVSGGINQRMKDGLVKNQTLKKKN